MTRKQHEIEKLQQQILEHQEQILKLQERVQQLEAMPDFDEEEPLFNFPDFPTGSYIRYAIYNLVEKKSNETKVWPREITVGDLIGLTSDELLQCRRVGPSAVKKLKNWMNSHGLQLID